jgi:hypothetical protein
MLLVHTPSNLAHFFHSLSILFILHLSSLLSLSPLERASSLIREFPSRTINSRSRALKLKAQEPPAKPQAPQKITKARSQRRDSRAQQSGER